MKAAESLQELYVLTAFYNPACFQPFREKQKGKVLAKWKTETEA